MNEDFVAVLQVFRDESHEILDRLAQETVDLHAAQGDQRRAALDAMKRDTHNLKGAAASVGVEGVARLAHAFEGALRSVGDGKLDVTNALVDSLLDAISLMQAVVEGQAGDEEVDEHLGRLTSSSHATASDAAAGLAPATVEGDASPKGGPTVTGPSAASTDRLSHSKVTGSVRVDVERLDSLMKLVGEMSITQARLHSRHKTTKELLLSLKELNGDEHVAGELAPIMKKVAVMRARDRRELLDFNELTTTFGRSMKRLRMMPLRALIPVWRRIVRESAHEAEKKVELQVDVGEVEVDKDVLDELRDPLMHLLRNAVDHGIESVAERERRGKPATGRLALRAVTSGVKVELSVCDDGRGLDAHAIAACALEKGLVSRDEAACATEKETLDLLFRAGFSTAKELTRMSGRGVGLDVVKTNVERLGGLVGVGARSSLGGAIFRLSVPLTTLSSSVLFVRCSGTLYSLPIDAVARTAVVAREMVRVVDGALALTFDQDEPMPLIDLHDLVGAKAGASSQKLLVVVLSREEAQMALWVDEVVGEQEVVVKNLPWSVPHLPLINGVIVLADGTLALALDVIGLMAINPARQRTKSSSEEKPHKPTNRILVVDDTMSARLLHKNMLNGAGYDVLVAVDGDEAWRMLQEQHVDLVVSDVQMPGLDGFALTRSMRNDPRLQDTPVLLVSSDGSASSIAKGAQVGADEYVVKGGCEANDLVALVTRYLEGPRDQGSHRR